MVRNNLAIEEGSWFNTVALNQGSAHATKGREFLIASFVFGYLSFMVYWNILLRLAVFLFLSLISDGKLFILFARQRNLLPLEGYSLTVIQI